MTTPPKYTIFLPTFNGKKFLPDILNAIFRQVVDEPFEVLVIDSGSTDGTLDVLSEMKAIRVIRIPNSEFQHGRTRNLAAREALGEIVVYLTQSSTPVDEHWLRNLTLPFEDESVVAVFGKHLPRPNGSAYVGFDVENTFHWLSPDDSVVKARLPEGSHFDELSKAEQDRLRFYSDANSALRKSFWRAHPYPEVEYAEDQLFGKQVLEAGFTKVYTPKAAVYHSHDLPLLTYFRRRFDEFQALEAIGQGPRPTTILKTLAGSVESWAKVAGHVARKPKYGNPVKRAVKAYGAGGYALADKLALLLAQNQRALPSKCKEWFSLERRLKKASETR